jgi:hypothetical protein
METLTRPGEHAPTNPPAVAFSSVMGICGLGLSWRAAGQVLAPWYKKAFRTDHLKMDNDFDVWQEVELLILHAIEQE